jgi:hypothetical protein
MMLFERRADAPRADPRHVLLERGIRPGETLELEHLGGEVLLLELATHLDSLGRIQTFLRGAPPLFAEIESGEGLRETVRIVPEMMAGGALVRPWLRGSDEWERWVLGERVGQIARLRFVDESGRWTTPLEVRVVRADALLPEVRPEHDARLRWSMFDPPPANVEAAVAPEHVTLRGYRDVLVLDAPSAVTFALAPGAYRLRAEYGFEPTAWRNGPTDGVIVRIERRGEGGARATVWERALDPRRNVEDGKLMTLAIDVYVEAGDTVALTTDPGPAGDAARDRVFWTNVSFAPVR